MGFMYILQCVDGTYYTGSTQNLQYRLNQHREGSGASYTRRRRPVRLIYFEQFENITDAFAREKHVQQLSRGAKRRLLQRGPGTRIYDGTVPWE